MAHASAKKTLGIKREHVRKVLRTASFALMMKGAVGGSVALLALFGVVVPYLGIEPAAAHEVAVGGTGAVLGVLLALKG